MHILDACRLYAYLQMTCHSCCKNHSSIIFFPFIVFYLIPNVKIFRDSGVSESNFVKSIFYSTEHGENLELL